MIIFIFCDTNITPAGEEIRKTASFKENGGDGEEDNLVV
jgi:hypothetical protein